MLEKMASKDVANKFGSVTGRARGKTREAMWDSTRTILADFYRPFNERLATKLGDDRWLWRM